MDGYQFGPNLGFTQCTSEGSGYSTLPHNQRPFVEPRDLADKNIALMALGPISAADTMQDLNSCYHETTPDRNHTCEHPYHSSYSENNLPLLLFRLEAPIFTSQEAPQPLIENGQPILDYQGEPVKAFPFLPRYISVRPSGWLIEFWMRSDARLRYRDIKARMTVSEEDLPSDNVLNMRRERDARKPLGLSCWTPRRGDVTRAEIERVENLSKENIMYNTSLRICTDARPFMLESISLSPGPKQYYPLDTFLDSSELHIAGYRLSQTVDLLYKLQGLAVEHGLDDWRRLPMCHLPQWWSNIKSTEHTPKKNPSHRKRSATKASKFSTPMPNSGNVSLEAPGSQGSSFTGWLTAGYLEGSERPYENSQSAFYFGNNVVNSSEVTLYEPVAHTSFESGMSFTSSCRYPPQQVNVFEEVPSFPAHQISEPWLARSLLGAVQSQERLPSILEGECFQYNSQAQAESQLAQAQQGTDLDETSFLCSEQASHRDRVRENSPPAYRFYGQLGSSIRNDAGHRLHTNTGEVMNHNDPFPTTRSHGRQMSSQRSFEQFLLDDLPHPGQ